MMERFDVRRGALAYETGLGSSVGGGTETAFVCHEARDVDDAAFAVSGKKWRTSSGADDVP